MELIGTLIVVGLAVLVLMVAGALLYVGVLQFWWKPRKDLNKDRDEP